MLDSRHKTFLALCEAGSFTRAAERLHMTQPAVSQHLRYLEDSYGVKLVRILGKRMELTPAGEKLFIFTAKMQANERLFTQSLSDFKPRLSFGATLTIGEFVMPNILAEMYREHLVPDCKMLVENTRHLLSRLDKGEILFALLEGFFDKAHYSHFTLSQESFVAVCSPFSPWARGEHCLQDLLGERLLLREEGSGTREILEQELHARNFSCDSFAGLLEAGNLNVIKELAASGLGITFLYEQAVKKELASSKLVKINLVDFEILREFNMVYLEDLAFSSEIKRLYDFILISRLEASDLVP